MTSASSGGSSPQYCRVPTNCTTHKAGVRAGPKPAEFLMPWLRQDGCLVVLLRQFYIFQRRYGASYWERLPQSFTKESASSKRHVGDVC